MSVPERASVTAKQAGGPDRRQAVSSGPATAPIGPARRWVGTVQPGTLRPEVPGLGGFLAAVADAVARVAVAGPGRFRKFANLAQTVHALSECWAPPAWAEPGAQRKGETPDA
jgi:hypothetical protein